MSGTNNNDGPSIDELLGEDTSSGNNNNNNNSPNYARDSQNQNQQPQRPKSLVMNSNDMNNSNDFSNNNSGVPRDSNSNFNNNMNNNSGNFSNTQQQQNVPQSPNNPLNLAHDSSGHHQTHNSPSSAWLNASGHGASVQNNNNITNTNNNNSRHDSRSGSNTNNNNNNALSQQNSNVLNNNTSNKNDESVSSIKPPPTDEELEACLQELITYQRHPAIFFGFVTFLCFVLSIASTATTAYTYDRGVTTTTKNRGLMDVTLWVGDWTIFTHARTYNTEQTLPLSSWCTDAADRWRAMQAFSILSVLYSAVVLVFGIAAVFPTHELAKKYVWSFVVGNRLKSPALFILILCSGFWFFLLVLWALMASTFHVTPCDTSVDDTNRNRMFGVRSLKDSGFKLSAGWALAFVMWCYLTGSLLWIWFKWFVNAPPLFPPKPKSGSLSRSQSQNGAGERKSSAPPPEYIPEL